VSDIFREVDEEVRREQLMKLWQRHGWLLIGACVVLVVAVGGWRAYQWWEGKKAAEAGAAFQAAIALSDKGQHKEAEDAFAKLATDSTASYRLLARIREAAEVAHRDPKMAVAIYDKLAADNGVNSVLQDVAALRAGLILVDIAAYEEIRQRLEPLAAPDRAFRHSARATLALSAWRSKDGAALKRWSDMVMADAETPVGTRNQIQMLLALSEADKKS
jgi:hypothetical protein